MFSIYRSQTSVVPLCGVWELADAAQQQAILRASHLLDQQLQHNPQQLGESRGSEVRILFQAPLGILYEIDEDKKLVRILRSWTFRSANAGPSSD